MKGKRREFRENEGMYLIHDQGIQDKQSSLEMKAFVITLIYVSDNMLRCNSASSGKTKLNWGCAKHV